MTTLDDYLAKAAAWVDGIGGTLPGHAAALAAAYPAGGWEIDGGARAGLDTRLPALTGALDTLFDTTGGAAWGLDYLARGSSHGDSPGWKSRVAAVALSLAEAATTYAASVPAEGAPHWERNVQPEQVFAAADRLLGTAPTAAPAPAAIATPVTASSTVRAAASRRPVVLNALQQSIADRVTAEVRAELAARRGTTVAASSATPTPTAGPTASIGQEPLEDLYRRMFGDDGSAPIEDLVTGPVAAAAPPPTGTPEEPLEVAYRRLFGDTAA